MNRSKRSGRLRRRFLLFKHFQLIQPSIFFLLRLDILTTCRRWGGTRPRCVPPRPKVLSHKVLCPSHIAIALFPLINPTTPDTEYFGGIDNSMCTWSLICCAKSRRIVR